VTVNPPAAPDPAGFTAPPGSRFREAPGEPLSSPDGANTLPAGGALAMGVSWAMLSSWGISTA
jgi:putative heme transporter